MKVQTDHKWKQFKYRDEVPEKVLSDYFEHLPDEFGGFIHYHKRWWHVSDFMRVDKNNPLAVLNYHGYSGDTYFSGAAIRLSDDGECYQIAYIYS